jgi:hypothetical protein
MLVKKNIKKHDSISPGKRDAMITYPNIRVQSDPVFLINFRFNLKPLAAETSTDCTGPSNPLLE